MQLTINGVSREFDNASALAHVLQRLEIKANSGGVAVALNDRVVSRTDWDSTPINDGDRIEIIQAVQGG